MNDANEEAVLAARNRGFNMNDADEGRRRLLLITMACAAGLALPQRALALSLADLSDKDASAGLKGALERGAEIAVSLLGKKDGFWGDERVRIPLPDWMRKVEKAIKVLGKSKDIEQMKEGVNRAAEQAVPQAKVLLAAAVKSMSVDDARKILAGGDNSVTQFFQEKTQAALAQKFLPVVTSVTNRIGLAQQYNQLAAQVQQTGLIALSPDQTRVESHVTKKALDGLYFMIGEEESKIRKDPAAAGSEIIKRVFGATR